MRQHLFEKKFYYFHASSTNITFNPSVRMKFVLPSRRTPMFKFGFSGARPLFCAGYTKHPLLLALAGSSMIAVFATALAVAPASGSIPRQTVIESLPTPSLDVLDNTLHTFFAETVIQRGDTLQRMLTRLNIEDSLAADFLRNAPEAAILRQEFIAGRQVSASATGDGSLIQLHFPLSSRDTALTIKRIGTEFHATLVADRPEVHLTTRSAQIEYSLFGATDAAGIPDAIAIQLAEIFSSEIDFPQTYAKATAFPSPTKPATRKGNQRVAGESSRQNSLMQDRCTARSGTNKATTGAAT